MPGDANLGGAVTQGRLKSSFIYLANAVNDLRGNWLAIGAVLAPLVLAGSLCLLPDALELQHQLAERFAPNAQSVIAGWQAVQTPYPAPPAGAEPLFPWWLSFTLHILFALITLSVNLVVLCFLAKLRSGVRRTRALNQIVDVYRRAFELLPSFLWISVLQVAAWLIGLILLVIPGLLVFIWLYFSAYALVFDGRRSWLALLYSRDLMRGQFFRVAVRIVVFLAVWSGYNSWAGAVFVAVSLLLGTLGAFAGVLWAGVFLADLLAVAVAYVTTALFFAAGVRLYADLDATVKERAAEAVALPPTAPLSEASI